MRLSLTQDLTGTLPIEMIIDHGGLNLRWNLTNFTRKEFNNNDNDVCKHINQFWETLPNSSKDSIFEIYVNISKLMVEEGNTTDLTKKLLPLIKELYEYHPIDKVEYWVTHYSDIIIPPNFKETYIEDDRKPGTRIKTYTRSDYTGLVAMTLALRPMIPVWGEYIYRTKNSIGTNFKEFQAFNLLATSNIMQSYPMEKLKLYVQHNIKNDNGNFSAILGGVGNEDFPMWLLGLVAVRRLCIGNIAGLNPEINLVTFVFNFISQKLLNNNSNTTFGHLVRTKEFSDGGSDVGDGNSSRAEGYKIKQELPTGDIAIIEHYTSDPRKMALQLDPTFDMDLLEVTLKTTEALNFKPISDHQVTLCQWVLAPIVPPKGFYYIPKQNIINCIAITEAWLWMRNHRHLSCLVSAIPSDNEDEVMLSGVDSRARITRDQMEVLTKLYPFGVQRNPKPKGKVPNDASIAIETVTDWISQKDWILTSHPDHTHIVTGTLNYSRYSAPHEIKLLLANLVIDLNRSSLVRLNSVSSDLPTSLNGQSAQTLY